MSFTKRLPENAIDAKQFQNQLAGLANTIALKVQREGRDHLPTPAFVPIDIYVLLMQSYQTYNLFCYLNADDRRKEDVHWKAAYSAAVLPLIRCMIDCLYNITAILENPGVKGIQFRESGYKRTLAALDADEQRYGRDPKWESYIEDRRKDIHFLMRTDDFTMDAINAAKHWPTLSAYLHVKKQVPLTPHQEFLKRFTYGFWQEYSGIAHATFDGLMPTAFFYTPGDIPHEDRPQYESVVEMMISTHVLRLAGILLCTLTEVQAYFRFDGAHINQRLHVVWNALLAAPEIKELYDERYAGLMRERGITPDCDV